MLSNDYLFYASSFVHQYSLNKRPRGTVTYEYYLIDSLFGSSTVGDILRLNQLSQTLMSSRSKYKQDFATIKFGDARFHVLIDSLVTRRLGIPTIGKPCPDPSFKNDLMEDVKLSRYRGTVIMVNFWATWCGPCLKEFPFENQLYEKYRHKGLTIVNVCVESTFEKWKHVSRQSNLQMVNLYSVPDEYAALKRVFDLSGFPRTVFIDREFNVIENYGVRASELSEKEIGKLIGVLH